MNQLKVTYEDREYEFVGYQHEGGTFALAGAGFGILVECSDEPITDQSSHAHFRLVPVRHTFGGVIWEEGERRQMKVGEASLEHKWLHIWSRDSDEKHLLLKAIEVIDACV